MLVKLSLSLFLINFLKSLMLTLVTLAAGFRTICSGQQLRQDKVQLPLRPRDIQTACLFHHCTGIPSTIHPTTRPP